MLATQKPDKLRSMSGEVIHFYPAELMTLVDATTLVTGGRQNI